MFCIALRLTENNTSKRRRVPSSSIVRTSGEYSRVLSKSTRQRRSDPETNRDSEFGRKPQICCSQFNQFKWSPCIEISRDDRIRKRYRQFYLINFLSQTEIDGCSLYTFLYCVYFTEYCFPFSSVTIKSRDLLKRDESLTMTTDGTHTRHYNRWQSVRSRQYLQQK